MNEGQLIQQVLSGDASAFSYFVDEYQHMGITIAYRVVGNMQDAEDVVQESFIKVFRNLHSFRKDSRFSSWFYRIVYNTAISTTKLKIWHDEMPVESLEMASTSEFDTEAKMCEIENSETVEYVLSKMSKGDALLLTLFYLEDNSIKEIASIMGLNIPNVKVRLHRARLLFKHLWTKNFDVPTF